MDSPFIESIEFKNFKALRDTKLPLGRFTLLIGPNGSGKSTVMQAVRTAFRSENLSPFRAVAAKPDDEVQVRITFGGRWKDKSASARWANGRSYFKWSIGDEGDQKILSQILQKFPVYSLAPKVIGSASPLTADRSVREDGGLTGNALDRIRDEHPERFEAINRELHHMLPEFDRILFDTPDTGQRRIALRMSAGGNKISAEHLSEGTLIALAILTIAWLPDCPQLVAFEEPDRGLHPRLLREVRDALYRLAYPEQYGESRPPVQVIATTHSPYMVDLFRDHPEEIVIAEKAGDNVKFERLSERADIGQILGESTLGEAWYSGVLGGVPAGS